MAPATSPAMPASRISFRAAAAGCDGVTHSVVGAVGREKHINARAGTEVEDAFPRREPVHVHPGGDGEIVEATDKSAGQADVTVRAIQVNGVVEPARRPRCATV